MTSSCDAPTDMPSSLMKRAGLDLEGDVTWNCWVVMLSVVLSMVRLDPPLSILRLIDVCD